MTEKGRNVQAPYRYSTFTLYARGILEEIYAVSGFPTRDEREDIGNIIGETEKRVQSWFKRNRKADRKRNREVARGDISDLLLTLQKTKSTVQLHPKPTKRGQGLVAEELPRDQSEKEVRPSLKVEYHFTPMVQLHPKPTRRGQTLMAEELSRDQSEKEVHVRPSLKAEYHFTPMVQLHPKPTRRGQTLMAEELSRDKSEEEVHVRLASLEAEYHFTPMVQLHPKPTRRGQTLMAEELSHDKSEEEARPSHLTPMVWPHPPLYFGVPYFSTEHAPYALPAVASGGLVPPAVSPNISPKKEDVHNSLTPAWTAPSSLKTNIRIRDPFEDNPTPTKKRKLSNDVTYHISAIEKTMADIYHRTSPLLPHMDSFLWGMEGPRCT